MSFRTSAEYPNCLFKRLLLDVGCGRIQADYACRALDRVGSGQNIPGCDVASAQEFGNRQSASGSFLNLQNGKRPLAGRHRQIIRRAFQYGPRRCLGRRLGCPGPENF